MYVCVGVQFVECSEVYNSRLSVQCVCGGVQFGECSEVYNSRLSVHVCV